MRPTEMVGVLQLRPILTRHPVLPPIHCFAEPVAGGEPRERRSNRDSLRSPAPASEIGSGACLERSTRGLRHAAFRPHLTVMPLFFASTSTPSGCAGDSDPQVVEHARHTKKPRGAQLHPGDTPPSDADAEAKAPYPRSPRWARRLPPNSLPWTRTSASRNPRSKIAQNVAADSPSLGPRSPRSLGCSRTAMHFAPAQRIHLGSSPGRGQPRHRMRKRGACRGSTPTRSGSSAPPGGGRTRTKEFAEPPSSRRIPAYRI
jgi:hypothetical protein